jgi:hypothetical protein
MSLRYGSEARHNFNTNAAPTTINAILPIPGLRIFVYRLLITAGTVTTPPATLKLQDTSANDMSQAFQLTSEGGIALDVPFNLDPWWFTGQALIQGAATAQQGGLTGAALTGNIVQGQGLGINFIVTGAPSALGWDIWWDAHP